MDSRICQTFSVSPAEPGDFPILVKTPSGYKSHKNISRASTCASRASSAVSHKFLCSTPCGSIETVNKISGVTSSLHLYFLADAGSDIPSISHASSLDLCFTHKTLEENWNDPEQNTRAVSD
jgi:hypothetical protein